MLTDESDHEDPCAALNIPANNLNKPIAFDSEDEEKGVYSTQNGIRKYIIEITDQDKIKQLIEDIYNESPHFGRGFIDSSY